jgi:hypothetical protein
MKLLNVRLSAEDVARVRALKRRGIVVSEVVRAAIAEAASRAGPRTGRGRRDVGDFLREIDERSTVSTAARLPDSPDPRRPSMRPGELSPKCRHRCNAGSARCRNVSWHDSAKVGWRS